MLLPKLLIPTELTLLSEEDLVRLRTAQQRRSAQLRVAEIVLIVAYIALMAVACIMLLNEVPSSLAWFGGLGACACFLLAVGLNSLRDTAKHNAALLLPLAECEDTTCDTLLELVESTPTVRAWVNRAVTSGRQLRVFDAEHAEVLQAEANALHQAHTREQACKTLHGLVHP